MNIRFALLSTVCVAYLATSASGLSLLAAGAAAKLGLIKGAVLGAGLAGLSRPVSETVVINESGQTVEVDTPIQVVHYQPTHPIPLPPQPAQGLIGGLLSAIQNLILGKSAAVGSLINAFAPSQQQVIVVVNNTETTTTTTTTERPLLYGLISVGVNAPRPEELVPVLVQTAPCTNCYY